MTPPIQLSLAGDGRLIILTPETVRKAYFQFTSASREYNPKKYRLYVRLHQQKDRTILDALHRRDNIGTKDDLHPKDILKVERELNQAIVRHNLALVNGEGQLLSGYGQCQKLGKNLEKVQYIIRYGLIFILEPTMKSKVITLKNTDIFWQDRNFDFHYVRYCGLLSSIHRQQIELLFRNRLDLAQSWTCAIDEFQPRKIYSISAIYPCEGFRLARTNI
jgi:hypothetical protein